MTLMIQTQCGEIPVNSTSIPQSLKNKVRIGDYVIPLVDFFTIVEYVLDNTDLEEDDVRLEFWRRMETCRIVKGYNEGEQRLELEIPWATWSKQGR